MFRAQTHRSSSSKWLFHFFISSHCQLKIHLDTNIWVQTPNRYKVCFIALDGTDEAEMVAFGDVARRIIGKPVQQLLRTSTSATVYPPEIARLVSLRFTFAITMTRQSYYKAQKTYNVAALVTALGQPVVVPDNAAHGDAGDGSGAESGDSSDKDGGQDARGLSASATPNSTQTSPGSLTVCSF